MPQAKCAQKHQYSVSQKDIDEGTTKGCPTCGQHFHLDQLVESSETTKKQVEDNATEQDSD